jgi:hypothetical protein
MRGIVAADGWLHLEQLPPWREEAALQALPAHEQAAWRELWEAVRAAAR